MNCPDCCSRLQEWLDGRRRGAATVPDEPPALCPACAEWAAAARRLDHGLRLLRPPPPPPLLADRIVVRLRTQRRVRRRRLVFAVGAAAVAATLLVAAWLNWRRVGPIPVAPAHPPEVVQAPEPQPAPSVSWRDSVAEAGSAVASLTSRTADETLAKTQGLLPTVHDPSLGALDLEPSLDPSARSLREAGEGVSAGLEPVTNSARRAVSLFFRELPPLEARSKTGL